MTQHDHNRAVRVAVDLLFYGAAVGVVLLVERATVAAAGRRMVTEITRWLETRSTAPQEDQARTEPE